VSGSESPALLSDLRKQYGAFLLVGAQSGSQLGAHFRQPTRRALRCVRAGPARWTGRRLKCHNIRISESVHAGPGGFVPEGGVAIQVLGEFSLPSAPVGSGGAYLSMPARADGTQGMGRSAGRGSPACCGRRPDRGGRRQSQVSIVAASAVVRRCRRRVVVRSPSGTSRLGRYSRHHRCRYEIAGTRVGLAAGRSCGRALWRLYQDIAPDIGDGEWIDAERERYRQLHCMRWKPCPAGFFVRAGTVRGGRGPRRDTRRSVSEALTDFLSWRTLPKATGSKPVVVSTPTTPF